MVDEKLTILTLFYTLILPITVFKKLTSLTTIGKYNYFLLDLALLVRVNSLWNKFCILVEVTQTYKTFTYCFILSSYLYFYLRDRKICVMLNLVNYPYIALSLRVKVRWEVMKFAGHGVISLLEQSNNKVDNFTTTTYTTSTNLNRKMLVGVLKNSANQYNFE
jgi:hypothetical protein